jgi:hypothetical protein
MDVERKGFFYGCIRRGEEGALDALTPDRRANAWVATHGRRGEKEV